jgi:GxxExxY protein
MDMGYSVQKNILYPELSFSLIGILFEVSRKLDSKFEERYFQKTVSFFLTKNKIAFKEQHKVKLVVDNQEVTYGIIDFIIEDKIVLEIKRGDKFRETNIEQVMSYLKLTGLQLGILANFTSRGLLYKRIINIT